MKYTGLLLIFIFVSLFGSFNGFADRATDPASFFPDTSINSIKLVNVSPDKKYALFSTSHNNEKPVNIHDHLGKEDYELQEIYNDRVVLIQYKGALISKRIVIQFDPIHPWKQNRFTYYPNGSEMPQKTYVVPSYGKGSLKGSNVFSTMKGSNIKK